MENTGKNTTMECQIDKKYAETSFVLVLIFSNLSCLSAERLWLAHEKQ
jgi:hypothetical protein